jgi:chromatin structure-remodeling complex subunit RSC9
LHHLVKISMERGDKYRFESFPGLAEALIEKLLEVSSLFYMVKWEIDYLLDGSMQGMNVLNGLEGTKDILKRIALLPKLHVDDNIQTAQFSDAMLLINEAGLTLRNMVLLEENAHYVSEMSPLRDFLTIALHLPKLDSLVELKHYALDIAEQLTKYISFDVADPLYISLLDQLQSFDRGTILASLRAINKISMNLEENNRLMGVPAPVVQNIMDWILLSDEDLVGACLDFLYQYTAVEQNVSFMLSKLQVDPLVVQLTRLLTHGAKVVESLFVRDRETRIPAPTALAALPQEVHAELEKMDEPERSSQWLRCLFEEDRDESVTQIFMWQAYQTRFTEMSHSTGRPLLAAAEFIKNVSTTFAEKAAAQVQPGPVQKFIIKGLRIRSTPVDLKGEEATKCKWELSNQSGQCDEFFMTPEKLYEHILKKHLNATQQEDGKFKNTHAAYDCRWGGCRRFHDSPAPSLVVIGKHIKVHFPTRKTSATKDSQKSKLSYIISPKKYSYKYQVTAVDERGEAAGIPLSAVLVLRNLARIIPKTEAEQIALKQTGVSWVDRLFKPVQPQLTEVMAHNRALVSSLFSPFVAQSDGDADQTCS